MRRARIIGAAVGALAGFMLGNGSGIVGGPFVGVAGEIVFVPLGAAWGLSAGPDLTDRLKGWMRR